MILVWNSKGCIGKNDAQQDLNCYRPPVVHHSKCGFHCSHEQGQDFGARYPPGTDEIQKRIQEAGGNADHGIKT